MSAHTLSRHEIEVLREELLRDFDWLEDGKIRLNVLCDMAIECLNARLKSVVRECVKCSRRPSSDGTCAADDCPLRLPPPQDGSNK